MEESKMDIYFDDNGDIKEEVLHDCIDNTNKLPALIEASVSKIVDIEKNVNNSLKKAHELQEKTSEMNEPKLFKKKESILTLQGIMRDAVDSQITSAKAQKLLFEYQRDLSKITSALYGLGVLSITANRCIVENLKTSLGKASEEELSEYARKQLLNVISQLKSNYDILDAQEKINDRLNAQARTVGTHIVEEKKRIAEQKQKNAEYDCLFAKQQQKDIEHDEMLEKQQQKDIEHDEMLAKQQQKDIEHDEMLANQQQKAIEHDEMLAKQQQKDIKHDRILKAHTKHLNEIDGMFATQEVKNTVFEQIFVDQKKQNAEFEMQIAAQKDMALLQENMLNKQAEYGDTLSKSISVSNQRITEVENEIKEISEQFETQKEVNVDLNSRLTEIQTDLEKARNQTLLKILCFVSLGISTISLILAILGFFL